MATPETESELISFTEDFTKLSELLGKMDVVQAARAISIAARTNPFLYQQLKLALPL
jgi:hypothetical protein